MRVSRLQNYGGVCSTPRASDHDGFLICSDQTCIGCHASNLAGDLYSLTEKTKNVCDDFVNLDGSKLFEDSFPQGAEAMCGC